MPTYNAQSSFTAQGLVLRRMLYTDLPLAREICEALEKIHHVTPEDWEWVKSQSNIMPFMEARYLMTNRILQQMGIHQVLELASGLSPRGMVMSENSACTFVEVDLPDELLLKRGVIKELVETGAIKPRNTNLHLLEGSVVEEKVFTGAEKFFRNEPVGVVCEGLLRYLSFADKAILAGHIRDLLKTFGGAWITPDIELLDDARQHLHRRVARMRGVDVEENLFADMATAKKFFEDFGFVVRITPLGDMLGQLSSQEKCGLTTEQTAELLEGRRTFTMTLV